LETYNTTDDTKMMSNDYTTNCSVKQLVSITTDQMPSETENPKLSNQNHQRMLHWQLQHKTIYL